MIYCCTPTTLLPLCARSSLTTTLVSLAGSGEARGCSFLHPVTSPAGILGSNLLRLSHLHQLMRSSHDSGTSTFLLRSIIHRCPFPSLPFPLYPISLPDCLFLSSSSPSSLSSPRSSLFPFFNPSLSPPRPEARFGPWASPHFLGLSLAHGSPFVSPTYPTREYQVHHPHFFTPSRLPAQTTQAKEGCRSGSP